MLEKREHEPGRAPSGWPLGVSAGCSLLTVITPLQMVPLLGRWPGLYMNDSWARQGKKASKQHPSIVPTSRFLPWVPASAPLGDRLSPISQINSFPFLLWFGPCFITVTEERTGILAFIRSGKKKSWNEQVSCLHLYDVIDQQGKSLLRQRLQWRHP